MFLICFCLFRSWEKLGVEVVLSTEDLTETKIVGIMHEASLLGAIEGIYVVITEVSGDDNQKDQTFVLNNIDAASRLLCPELK